LLYVVRVLERHRSVLQSYFCQFPPPSSSQQKMVSKRATGTCICMGFLVMLLLCLFAWIYFDILPTWVEGTTSDLVRNARVEMNAVQSLENELIFLRGKASARSTGSGSGSGSLETDTAAHAQNNSPGDVSGMVPGPGKKWVLAFDLYGSQERNRYSTGAVANADLAGLYYPGWTARFYVDGLVPPATVAALEARGAEVIRVSSSDQNSNFSKNQGQAESLAPMAVWRFRAAYDPSAERFVVRDIDSRLNAREAAAVAEWVRSDADVHVMRDHPSHCNAAHPVLAGMWGGKTAALPWLEQKLRHFEAEVHMAGAEGQIRVGADQDFLREHLWAKLQTHGGRGSPAAGAADTQIQALTVLQHDSYCCRQYPAARPFPSPRRPAQFVGQIFNAGGTVRFDHYSFVHVPPKCRLQPEDLYG